MEMLNVSHVGIRFGSHEIIKDLSFTVPEHTIYGFIGQNGAGKTTTMKMILGLYEPTAGEITVNGERVTYGQNRTNQFIGYLPDVPEFYPYMTPKEYLTLCGKITGMTKGDRNKRIPELLEMVGLASADKRIRGFSRGMKQRLGVAQALLNRPKLLICDEPTSALDPVGRKEILDMLQSVREETTVLFSTHILSDVERICDEIGVIHEGHLALTGTLDEIREKHSQGGFFLEFHNATDAQQFVKAFDAKPEELVEGQCLIRYPGYADEWMRKAMQTLVNLSLTPVKVEAMEPTLESLFMEVTGQ